MGGYQIYALLLTISSIGVPNAISKLISEKNSIKDYYNKERIFKCALLIFGTIGFLGTFSLYILSGYISSNILGISKAKLSLQVLSPAIFLVSISSVLRGYCNGENNVAITAKSQIIEQIFKSGLTIVFVEIAGKLFNNNIEIMAAFANLATTVAISISFMYILNKTNKLTKLINKIAYPKERIIYIIKKIFYCSIPITLCSILAVLGKNIDSVTVVNILKKYLGEEKAIIKYGILSSKVDLLVSMPLAFNNSISTALVPEISKLKIKNDIIGVENKIVFSIFITLIICVPYAFGIFFYSKEIFELLFPRAYEGAELLKISAISIVFAAVTQTINSSLQGLGKNNIPLISSFIGIIFKTILNILLINIFLEKGAIISNIISNAISFFIVFSYLNRYIKLKFDLKFFSLPLIFSIFMIICSRSLYFGLEKILNIHLLVIIFVIAFSVLFYCFCLIFVKKINKKIKLENR